MNTQSMTLDISKRASAAPILVIRQGDRNGTNIEVSVCDNGRAMDLTRLSARLCMKLPDGEHYYSVDGSVSGSIATFAIDETYAAAYTGTTDTAYVEVLDGEEVICSTHHFTVAVEPCARDGAEPGPEYISEIDDLVERVEEVIASIEEGAVFGVKGDAEDEYRVGNVNLTAENIGVDALTNLEIEALLN